MKNFIKNIQSNLLNLSVFEFFYKSIFVFLLFPLIKLLFNYSIYYLGFEYLRNQTLLFYLTKISSISVIVFILFVLIIYLSFEILCLINIIKNGNLYKSSKKEFMIFCFKSYKNLLKNKKVMFFIILALFVFIIEFIHIVNIGRFIHFPLDLLRFITLNSVLLVIVVLFSLFMTYLVFIYLKSRLFPTISKKIESNKKSLINFLIFIFINVLLNIIFYIFYDGIFLIISSIITNHEMAIFDYKILLTLTNMFLISVIILATILLLPINLIYFYTLTHFKEDTKVALKNVRFKRIRYFYILLILIFLLFVSFLTVDHDFKEMVSDHEIMLVAHRGYSKSAPENTLSAIDLAIDNGANAIEFDVRLTKDLIPVLLHDETLGRTTNDQNNRKISNVTLNELHDLDAGSWFGSDFTDEKIPTLLEVIIRVKQLKENNQFDGLLFIELKDDSFILDQLVVNILLNHQMINEVKILSFSYDQLVRIKNLNNNIYTTLLVSSFYGDYIHLFDLDFIDSFGLSMNFIDEYYDMIQKIQSNGQKVFVWTVDKEKDIKKYMDLNVDGIITNDVSLAKSLIVNHEIPNLYIVVLKNYYLKKQRILNLY